MKLFLDGILFSYAQIFFSNRRWFGVVILAVSLLSPEIGLMGLFGAAFSNGIASALKFDKEKIRTGFYGFNGILLGAASTYFFALNLQLLLLISIFIIITFFITAVLENYFATAFNLPGLSLPFILSLYVFLVFLGNYSTISANTHTVFDKTFFSFLPNDVSLFFKSISLIILQPSITAGIIIFAAIFFFSRVHFVFMMISFASGRLFLWLLLPNLEGSLSTLMAFNSLLTAIALGGSLIILSKKSIYLILLSSLMVVVFSGFFHIMFLGSSLPILVLPFNLIVLTTIYSLKFRQQQSDLVLLYFTPGSPEENYYYHQTKRKRFENFKDVFAELPFFG
ncbi:MAG: urea transporter, partial [Ignavibacteria bacterium]|nr:urea transporter [Ignavibacteria bacterium]